MKKSLILLTLSSLIYCGMSSKDNKTARDSTRAGGYSDTSTTGSTDTNVGRDTGKGSTAGTVPTNADTEKNAVSTGSEYDTNMGRKKTKSEMSKPKQMSRGNVASGTVQPAY